MKIVILALSLLLILFDRSYGLSEKEVYELQEKCGKSAGEFFKSIKDHYQDTSAEYQNHYNRKSNKCFVAITWSFMEPKIEFSGSVVGTMRRLMVINENKELGHFNRMRSGGTDSIDCVMLGKECHSIDEWDAFIKPYMEK